MTALRWGAATDVGRARSHNEDSFCAAPPVFAVADGMGGHAAGDIASALVVAELHRIAAAGTVTPEGVETALQCGNDAILARARSDAELTRRGMGTTVAGAALLNRGGVSHWLVFNIGDSRVYRTDSGGLSQLTTDHSEVAELVGAGAISRDQARSHPLRNVLTRSLGFDATPRADLRLLPAALGDRLLVCSDGLTNELADDAISLLLRVPDPQRASDALVAAACSAGGRDNVTVVIVDLVDHVRSLDEDTIPRSALPRQRSQEEG